MGRLATQEAVATLKRGLSNVQSKLLALANLSFDAGDRGVPKRETIGIGQVAPNTLS